MIGFSLYAIDRKMHSCHTDLQKKETLFSSSPNSFFFRKKQHQIIIFLQFVKNNENFVWILIEQKGTIIQQYGKYCVEMMMRWIELKKYYNASNGTVQKNILSNSVHCVRQFILFNVKLFYAIDQKRQN